MMTYEEAREMLDNKWKEIMDEIDRKPVSVEARWNEKRVILSEFSFAEKIMNKIYEVK